MLNGPQTKDWTSAPRSSGAVQKQNCPLAAKSHFDCLFFGSLFTPR